MEIPKKSINREEIRRDPDAPPPKELSMNYDGDEERQSTMNFKVLFGLAAVPLLFVLCGVISPPAVYVNELDTRIVSVLAGDTVRVRFGGTQRIRIMQLLHVGVLSRKTELGHEAYTALAEILPEGTPVRVLPDEARSTKAILRGYVFVLYEGEDGHMKEINLNLFLIAWGIARYSRNEGPSALFHEDFVKAEAEAQAAKVGMWSALSD